MKKIVFKQKEMKQIQKIVSQYKKVETELSNIQAKLNMLDIERTKVLHDLDAIREDEEKFFDKIKETYGDGKLDLNSMQYITD